MFRQAGDATHQRMAVVMASFLAGLFVGEAVFEEIRDNLDLERWFRLPKSHERRIHGHRHAGVRIVQEGPTLVHALDAHRTHPGPFTAVDLQQRIVAHPMQAAMLAAAAGAGLMGLLTLAMRSSPSTADRLAEPAVPDAATRNDLADLRDQLTSWARDRMAAAPSRTEVKQGIADASDSATTTWNDVRDQASDLAQRVRSQVEDTADRLRPKVTAAVDLAKDNPMWLGVAAATLAAVIGASAIASARK